VNFLIRELCAICRDHLLDEKWVIAPSLRAGHEWLMAVARAGQPVINAHVKTLRKLALDLAAPRMAEQEWELISGQQAALLIERVMQRLRQPEGGYLWRLPAGVRLAEAVFKAIDAVRRAGLDTKDLKGERFEVEIKGREIQAILAEYVKELYRGKWVDGAGVLRLAIERLRADQKALASDVLVLVPEDIDVLGLERQLLAALPQVQLLRLGVDQPAPESAPAAAGQALTDSRLLRWLMRPAQAPAPSGDGSARIFRAVGEVNEVCEVLRRCMAESIPLDEVEVLCSDVATYIPLVYETFARLLPDEASSDDIPVTFQEGIPARSFRPGRALRAWLAWVRDDFPQRGLIHMVQEGLLDIPGHEQERISFSRLAAEFRKVGIGFGRQRYLAMLDQCQTAWELRRNELPRFLDEDDEARSDRPGHMEERLEALGLLRSLVESLLELSPGPNDGATRVLERAQRFLEKHSRRVSQLDNYAWRILISRITEMRAALDQDAEAPSVDARAWLAALPDEAWVGGLGPRSGCLHVAHVLAGGHSGRRNTFIVGLDDGRFPGPGLQDPILLDDERRGISQELLTSDRELAKRIELFARLLARLRGTVTLSYSCQNLVEDREVFPSPVVLSAFRILSGQHEGDQGALDRWLPPPESFAPDLVEKALTESEWWLWRMTGAEEVVEPRELVAARYAHLGRGFALARERESDRFTVYDGWIQVPGAELDPTADQGPAVSASRLETLGQCPLRYFFRYVLEIEPPEELTIDPETWLDPLARGSLLHEVFESFLKELIERGHIPEAARDAGRLSAILKARIDHYRNTIPPPSEAVFRREVRQLERAARIFLHEEERYCKESGNRPLFVEAAIGAKAEGSGTPLDTEEPVRIRLPDGRSLRVRARIDRVDRVRGADANVLTVWDYKTGGTWKYQQERLPFWEGRVIQHALYLLVMNARLKAMGNAFAGARVEDFGFFFPSEKGGGERITLGRADLEGGASVLSELARIAANGAFLATTQPQDDCTFCKFRAVCGDVEAVGRASDRKLQNRSSAILEPLARLRGYGQACK
jgi:ATP-dependent helicase/nuclease subunit B